MIFKTRIDEKIKAKPGGPKEYSKLLTKISEGLGISKTQLRSIRKGKSIPNGKQLLWFAKFFDCTIDELIVHEEEQQLAAA